ncbi:UNKNOWN [Stylonychia lemnae]|uniref:Uncharacterized protein n=1 Tax=Stylonychia lemnae TaxID=5949 RepID=A0A078A336_STYLE|nr:UNKNOWN [Stylonychia lemnae]|eukprot:CDW76237.1 UNKNOWN [Stylonychia lemnae]
MDSRGEAINQKIQKKFETFIKQCERSSNNVVKGLEQKLSAQKEGSERVSEASIVNNVQSFFQQQKPILDNFETQQSLFLNYFESIDKIQLTYQEVNIDIQIQSEEILCSFNQTSFEDVNRVVTELPINIFAYSQKGQTKIIELKQVNDSIVRCTEKLIVNREVQYITVDQDRILCDDSVYSMNSLCVLDIIKFSDEIVGGIQIRPGKVIFGHNKSSKMSIWQWTGTKYQFLKKKQFYPTNGAITLMKAFPLREDCITVKCGDHQIKLFQINMIKFGLTQQTIICSGVKHIYDYRVISEDKMLLSTAGFVVYYDIKYQTKVNVFQTTETLSSLMIMPQSISNSTGLEYCLVDSQKKIQYFDLQEQGLKGSVEGMDGMRLIAQMSNEDPNSKKIIVMCQNKSGQLCLRQILKE